MMNRCFDAHVYVSNFGDCHLLLKFPATAALIKAFEAHRGGRSLSLRRTKSSVLLQLAWFDESGDWDMDDDASMWMPLLPLLRNDLLSGDHRPLYLA